jgi:hypothetical protein
MNLKRLLGAEHGWGGATGTLLLLGFGLAILFISVAGLKEASRLEPEERGCAAWLADPSGARWVRLVGCKLALGARARGGGPFIPLFAGDAPSGPARAVLATTDKDLLVLLDGIDRLGSEQDVQAYLLANAATLDGLLEPKTLTGYVEPVKSAAARSALGVLTAEDAMVLEQGKQPPRANALFGLVVGLIAVALVARSVFMRYLVERDSTL